MKTWNKGRILLLPGSSRIHSCVKYKKKNLKTLTSGQIKYQIITIHWIEKKKKKNEGFYNIYFAVITDVVIQHCW